MLDTINTAITSIRSFNDNMSIFFYYYTDHLDLHSFPTRRSSDLLIIRFLWPRLHFLPRSTYFAVRSLFDQLIEQGRSEEHTSELQSQSNLVCRLLLEKKNYSLSRFLEPQYNIPALSSVPGAADAL